MDANNSKQVIITQAREAYKFHINEADFYKKILESAGLPIDKPIKEKPITRKRRIVKKVAKQSVSNVSNRNQFGSTVINILQERDKPQILSEILKEFNQINNSNYVRKNFASSISKMIKGGTIDRFEHMNDDGKPKRFYGLSKWFKKKGELQESYKNKIKSQLLDPSLLMGLISQK
jgi:hypothetical protein